MVQHSAPRALTIPELHGIVADYAQANARTDEYGGSLHNRLRFPKAVAQAVTDVVGKERIGVRLAPLTTLQGAVDDTPEATCLAAAHEFGKIGVAYVHIAEADWEDAPVMPAAFKEALREVYLGTLINSGNDNKARRGSAGQGLGRPDWIWPQLHRQSRAALSPAPRPACGGAAGHTDYPEYVASAAA